VRKKLDIDVASAGPASRERSAAAPEEDSSAAASTQASAEISTVVRRPWSSQTPDWPLQSTLHLNW